MLLIFTVMFFVGSYAMNYLISKNKWLALIDALLETLFIMAALAVVTVIGTGYNRAIELIN